MKENSLKKRPNVPKNLVYDKIWVLSQWGKYWCLPINDVGIIHSDSERKQARPLPYSIRVNIHFLCLYIHTSFWYKYTLLTVATFKETD